MPPLVTASHHRCWQENVHLIGLIKRRVRNIVFFTNTVLPLHGRSYWDPAAQATNSSDCLPTFFGVRVKPVGLSELVSQDVALDYSADQVFAQAEYLPLVRQLQAAQQAGGGVVVTTPLVTVANAHWAVPAGIEVNVTWVYLSRAGEWERRLPAEVRAKLQPAVDDPYADYGETVKGGEYAGFPHYSTGSLAFSPAAANALADLTGWTVLNNADTFRKALGRR